MLITSNAHMAKTTPPGNGSRLLKINQDNPLWKYFQLKSNGIRFLATGPFDKGRSRY